MSDVSNITYIKMISRTSFNSKEELAHEADSNRTYISDVERGGLTPSIIVVERIAKALGKSMGDLLD